MLDGRRFTRREERRKVEERAFTAREDEENMYLKIVLVISILMMSLNSCVSKKLYDTDETLKVYGKILSEMDEDIGSILLEATNGNNFIEIQQNFGITQHPFTGELVFRDYIAFPYYSIRRFKNALSGIVTNMENDTYEKRIIIKSGNLEIEYFGHMIINERLAINSVIEKGTFIGEMQGGGDSGMVLKIRMKYKGILIDPSVCLDINAFLQLIQCIQMNITSNGRKIHLTTV